MAGHVLASHSYCSVFFPKQVLGVCSRPLGPALGPCTHTHLHMPAHLPCSRQALAAGFAAVHPLLESGPGPSSLLPPTLSAPKVLGAPQEPCLQQVSASPFWVFQEDGEEENTSMNSMFPRCLIKRDKIAEALGAGLAGVGSHALLPCVLLLAEPSQLLCPPRPQLRYWAPTGGSEGGRSPGRLIVQKAAPPAPSTQPEFPGWGEGNSRALRVLSGQSEEPRGQRPSPAEGPLRRIPCTGWRDACFAPHTPAVLPLQTLKSTQ